MACSLVTIFILFIVLLRHASADEDLQDIYGLPKGYTLVPMTFVGTFNGHEIHMNGTVQEVVAHLRELDPNIEFLEPSTNIASRMTLSQVRPPLCCPVPGQPWFPTSTIPIRDGLNYLANINVEIRAPAGPGVCGRISCSWDSGIFLCNDNRFPISVNSHTVAVYVQDLIDVCGFPSPGGSGGGVGGQEFDTSGWNVYVTHIPWGSHC